MRALVGALAGRPQTGPVQPDELLKALSRDSGHAAAGQTEKDKIVDTLWRNGFSRTRTADALGVSRKTLYNKMKKFGLAG